MKDLNNETIKETIAKSTKNITYVSLKKETIAHLAIMEKKIPLLNIEDSNLLSIKVMNSRFKNVFIAGKTELKSVYFDDSIIENIDIHKTKVFCFIYTKGYINRANLSGTKFTMFTYRQANLTSSLLKACTFEKSEFVESFLFNVLFTECDFNGIVFKRSHFSNVHFNNCIMNGTFEDCSFDNCTFCATKISGNYAELQKSNKVAFLNCTYN